MANEYNYNSNFNYNDPIGSYNVLSSTSTVTIDKLSIDNSIYSLNAIVYAKYKISKFNKIEIDIKFNKIEKNLTFDIINKETIKLTLENK